MNKTITTSIGSALICLIWLSACNPKSAEHNHDHDHNHSDSAVVEDADHISEEKGSSIEEVHLIQKQMDVMHVELGHFQYLNLSTTVKANGVLQLPPQKKASLSAIMGGRVRDVLVLAGDYVQKGQVLARLEHPDFIQLQQDYLKAMSRVDFLENEYKRQKDLYSDSISSQKKYQLAKSEYESARAEVNGLKSKLEMLHVKTKALEQGHLESSIPVQSPINGYVRLVEINIGKFVQPQQEMFEIVDNDHIHIDLTVYEKDMHKIANGQKVIFSLSNNQDSVFIGSIFAVGRAFEQNPKAMIVHAELDNKGGNLIPGMYVDARIVTNEETVRSIPNEAIVSDAGLSYIFVLNKNEDPHHQNEYVFRKIEVNTGASDIGFTEVVPAFELSDQDKIVTSGAFYLLAELKKGEGGHGHHH